MHVPLVQRQRRLRTISFHQYIQGTAVYARSTVGWEQRTRAGAAHSKPPIQSANFVFGQMVFAAVRTFLAAHKQALSGWAVIVQAKLAHF